MRSSLKWILNKLTERRFKREVEALSYGIEKRITESLAPIDEKSAPKEVQPLIHAINRLIAYFEDRSLHEQDFSSNASHELRTPLAGIRLQTEIAMTTDDIKIQKQCHHNILIAVDQNERLIEQLLSLARLTSDRVDLTMEKLNINQLSAHVIANLRSLAKAKHIEVKLESKGDLFLIASNESISILLHNLLRNAIYHTPEGGNIRVVITALKDRIVLSVIDSGPGILPDKFGMVLERFQKSRNTSGSGLGLSIVKRICDLHHAALELRTMSKKGGLKVTVVFKR